MATMTIDGVKVQADEGSTVLEVAKFYGFDIPTLCFHEELTPYGACRLCMVEVKDGRRTKVVASCLYPVKDGLEVKTSSARIVKERRLLLELMIARCPNSKILQDMASKMGVEKVRFKMENEDCILCGLCVRMCEEQMKGGAIGFVGRGPKREIATPFREVSEICRNCGGCMYICPLVDMQCRGRKSPGDLCNSCLTITPRCVEKYDQIMCTQDSCGACVQKEEK